MEAEVSISEETNSLIKELVGTKASLKETVESLTFIATEMMPTKEQRRLSHLLWKNQDGTITVEEEKELDALIDEGQEGTIRKAKAILALKHLGIDIIPDLEARVRVKYRNRVFSKNSVSAAKTLKEINLQ